MTELILVSEDPEWWWIKGRRYIATAILTIFIFAWTIRWIIEKKIF